MPDNYSLGVRTDCFIPEQAGNWVMPWWFCCWLFLRPKILTTVGSGIYWRWESTRCDGTLHLPQTWGMAVTQLSMPKATTGFQPLGLALSEHHILNQRKMVLMGKLRPALWDGLNTSLLCAESSWVSGAAVFSGLLDCSKVHAVFSQLLEKPVFFHHFRLRCGSTEVRPPQLLFAFSLLHPIGPPRATAAQKLGGMAAPHIRPTVSPPFLPGKANKAHR